MLSILAHELKSNRKNLILWSLIIGGLGFACILLYAGMEDSISEVAESFSQMGAFSDAFGMSTLSLATLSGYFATEIGTIHSLGSGMFAASVATVILSKEEDGHTGEFLYALPVSRVKIVLTKLLFVLFNIIMLNAVCALLYSLGFIILNEEMAWKVFFLYMGMQTLMNIEVAAICFFISAISRKNKLGAGLGVALLLYAYDIMARILPDLKDTAFLSPYSYANSTDIFSGCDIDIAALLVGLSITIILLFASHLIYSKRDLAS